jgi:ubiquinone/menaquinone biosynthesis C-methylase UbiE
MPNSDVFHAINSQELVDSYFLQEASYWEKIYHGTGVMDLVHQERLRLIVDLAQKFAPARTSRILDIGCGAGLTAVALGKRDYTVHAVDSVFEMLDLTRKRALREGLESRIKCARGDIHCLAFADQSFDLVIAAGVLPWLPSVETPVKEMCRILKPGGRLILSLDNSWGLCWFMDPLTNPLLKPIKELTRGILSRLGKRKPRLHVQMMSIGESYRLLSANGLRTLEDTTLGFGPICLFRRDVLPHTIGVRLQRRLQSLADRGYPLLNRAGAQYVVVAEKGPAADRLEK